jgi:hypothetical protein
VRRPICATLVVVVALGQPVLAASPQEIERARQMSAAGAEAFRAKNFDEALAAFEEANRLVPHPNLDVNIGRTYEALGRADQAMIHCKIALNAPGVPENTRQAAQQCVERVQKLLTRPVLQVESRPPGAVVRVDGAVMGNTPWQGEVEAGRRQIDVELEGYKTSSRTLNAERGDVYPIDLTLITANIGGLLSVSSIPTGAYVFLDGDEVGPTPLRGFQVDARSYVLEVRKVGFSPAVSTISVEDGKQLERVVTLVPIGGVAEPSKPLPRWPGWTMIGLSGAAVGVGAYFGLQAADAYDKADRIKRTGDPDDPADVAAHDKWVSKYDDNVLGANLLFIGGGLLLAGGLTWLLWPQPEEPADASAAPAEDDDAPAPAPSRAPEEPHDDAE